MTRTKARQCPWPTLTSAIRLPGRRYVCLSILRVLYTLNVTWGISDGVYDEAEFVGFTR